MIGQDIGKYRVLDRIGRGGMGTVYRAIDETLKRDVAIKVLNAELNDPSVARRFRAEAVTVARLSHPGIATIYELFEYDGQWLMVMEFVRGETLEALVARKGPLAANESAELCMQALGALAHAHSLGVVHRDLKPANLMVTESGAVKIMDFGIARVVGTEHLTSAGFMMGTPAYMAPEQVRGEDIDARADLYAIGVVLYHLVTAALPFKGDTPFEMAQSRLRDQPTPVRSVRADLPPWLGQVLEFALAPDLPRRFQSAALFRDGLRRGLAGLPLETPDTSDVPPELVATAAPGSMRVPVDPVGVPVTTAASGMTSRPSEPVANVPSALEATSARASTPAGKRDTRPTRVAIVALLGLILVLLGWMALGSQLPSLSSTGAPPLASTGPAPNPSLVETPAPPPAAPPAAADSVLPPATTPAAPVRAAGGPTATTPSGDAAGSSARATVPGRAAGARGRGEDADLLLTYPDVRFLQVTGRKAEERPGLLRFGVGEVVVASESGTPLVTMPYTDLSYALYMRARDPKWSVVLAAPPANVDLPGGLFRGTRHWLTLQSRAAFLIVRLNDNSWSQVLETVTARTGVQVAREAAPRQ